MFKVLTASLPAVAVNASGLDRIFPAREEARYMAGVYGSVDYSRVAVFAHMQGQWIHCTSGHLWVTLGNDQKDHVLLRNQWLLVATNGKVIIGGRGGYEI